MSARATRALAIRGLGPLLLLLVARAAGAQEAPAGPRLRPLARGDVIAARTTAVQGGLGVTTALGNYVRLDAVAGAGVEDGPGPSRASARGDLLARFVVDPFRQSRWSPYGGAGVSALRREGDWRGYLLAVLGMEGPATRGVLPALELGLGGGARVGLVLRRAAPGRR